MPYSNSSHPQSEASFQSPYVTGGAARYEEQSQRETNLQAISTVIIPQVVRNNLRAEAGEDVAAETAATIQALLPPEELREIAGRAAALDLQTALPILGT